MKHILMKPVNSSNLRVARFLIPLLIAIQSFAADITLSWNSKNATGYILTYGSAGVTTVLDVNSATNHRVTVSPDRDYEFFVTPYGNGKILGPKSNTIKFSLNSKTNISKLTKPELKIINTK